MRKNILLAILFLLALWFLVPAEAADPTPQPNITAKDGKAVLTGYSDVKVGWLVVYDKFVFEVVEAGGDEVAMIAIDGIGDLDASVSVAKVGDNWVIFEEPPQPLPCHPFPC